MSIAAPKTLLREASIAWKLLNGITCIYKQPGVSTRSSINIIKQKLCDDLNEMQPMPTTEIVEIRRIEVAQDNCSKSTDGSEQKILAQILDGQNHHIEVAKVPNYANHRLLVGPGYQSRDVKFLYGSFLSKNSSGLVVLGINGGCKTAQIIKLNKWISSYVVSGQFGKATNTFFHTGKVLQKSSYHRIRLHMIERILSASQASNQRVAFASAGVPLNSERAYELASTGLVRPQNNYPLVYHVKCLKFNPPDFELELHAINESENFICQFVHELGIKLHSLAVCTKIRCVKVGPFNLEMALLPKHWNLENVLDNCNKTYLTLKDINLYERTANIDLKKMI